jgi:hypothetical protein
MIPGRPSVLNRTRVDWFAYPAGSRLHVRVLTRGAE